MFAVILHPERRELMRPAVVSFLMIGVGIIPIVAFVVFRGQGRLAWVPPLSVRAIGKVLTLFAGSAAALVLFSIAIWRSLKEAWRSELGGNERWSYWVAGCWTVVPVLMTALMSLHSPVLMDRFLLMSVPPVVLLGADGICRFEKRAGWMLTGMLVLVSIGADAWLYQRRSLQDTRSAANYVLDHAVCGAPVIFVPEYGRLGFEYYEGRRPGTPCASGISVLENEGVPSVEQGKHVWVVEMLGQGAAEHERAETFAARLGRKFKAVSAKHFEGFEVREFEQRLSAAEDAPPWQDH